MTDLTLFVPSEAQDGSDEEEIQQRNDYDVEAAVREYVDEDPIRHDTIPDFEPGGDKEEEETVRSRNQHQHTHRRGSGNMFIGRIFYNAIDFKECVLDHALSSGGNIKQFRYCKKKLGFMCDGGRCKWRVYCSISGNIDQWQIKKYNPEHSCTPNGECEMVKVPVIARLFLDKIRDEPDYYLPMKIEEEMHTKWKVVVTRPQCQAARLKVLRLIEREYDRQFERLRDYAAEIVKSNPGSTVEIDTTTNEEGLDVFNRFYVCFECVRTSWKETCRPLIGLDGCFMRGKMKGQVLVALGRDGNNGIYPLAWGVVQVDNTPNWLWFVQKVKADLGLGDGEGFIMILDRQKGLITAVENELPKVEHRMCVRHIYANLKAKHGKKSQMKPFIWNLAWSYNEVEYNENLDRIFNYDIDVYNDVMKSKPRTWCRAFYKIGSHCEDVENNSTESFNASIIKASEKPLVPMLETIARLAMVRIAKRNAKVATHKGLCTLYAQNFLAGEYDNASDCQVHRSTNLNFQVIHRGCSYRVSLDKRTCTCKKWDITGIPCEHGYAVIMKMKFYVDDYVSHWFRTDLWQRTYTRGLTPMRGARFWPRQAEGDIQVPPEPAQPGRKKKAKRKKGLNESPTKKQKTNSSQAAPSQTAELAKRVMTCKVCGEKGHNSRKHKNSSQPDPSQGIVTQES